MILLLQPGILWVSSSQKSESLLQGSIGIVQKREREHT